MRAVNDHFVANLIHHGNFFSGGNPGHPLAGGLIAPLLDAGGFRHRFSRDLSGSPVPWRSDGDVEPDFGSGNVIDVPAEAWDGKWFDGAAGGDSHISAKSHISATGSARRVWGRSAWLSDHTFPSAPGLSDGNDANGHSHRFPWTPGPTSGIEALFDPPAADDGSGTPFEVSTIDLPPTAAESHFHDAPPAPCPCVPAVSGTSCADPVLHERKSCT